MIRHACYFASLSVSRHASPLRISRSFASGPAPERSALPSASVSSPGLHNRTGIVHLYLQLLGKHPVLTKSVTAGTIYFLADVTSQGISISQVDKAETLKWDFKRTLRMVAAGFFMSGPSLHLWFNLMSKTFPKRDLVNTLKKMLLGQTVYGPTFTVAFFSLNAFAQGESTDEVVLRLKRDFVPTLKSGLMYWPLCDFITYRYVPVHLQGRCYSSNQQIGWIWV